MDLDVCVITVSSKHNFLNADLMHFDNFQMLHCVWMQQQIPAPKIIVPQVSIPVFLTNP